MQLHYEFFGRNEHFKICLKIEDRGKNTAADSFARKYSM